MLKIEPLRGQVYIALAYWWYTQNSIMLYAYTHNRVLCVTDSMIYVKSEQTKIFTHQFFALKFKKSNIFFGQYVELSLNFQNPQ